MRLHSWLSDKCRIAPSSVEGQGVFAREALAAGELVAVWGGVVYTSAEVQSLQQQFPNFGRFPVEIAAGYYLCSTSLTAIDDAERFNHSCDPNLDIQGQIIVVTRRQVSIGEELTFDYGMPEDPEKTFECRCRTADCRRLVNRGG